MTSLDNMKTHSSANTSESHTYKYTSLHVDKKLYDSIIRLYAGNALQAYTTSYSAVT